VALLNRLGAVIRLVASKVGRLARQLQVARLGKLLEQFGKLGVVLAAFQYVYEAPARDKQKQLAMWQVVTSARGSSGDGGRIYALESLNGNGASLEGADLSLANLNGADLRGADLRSANLKYASLVGTNLCAANLNGADLTGAKLAEVDARWANFGGAILDSALMAPSRANHSDFTLAKFHGAQFYPSAYDTIKIQLADFRGANSDHPEFLLSDLRDTTGKHPFVGKPITVGADSLMRYVDSRNRGAPMPLSSLHILYARRAIQQWAVYPVIGAILRVSPSMVRAFDNSAVSDTTISRMRRECGFAY
jgi:hypothetical protein